MNQDGNKKVELKAEYLFDGDFLNQVNASLALLGEDVIDRPHIDKPRKLKIEISITPKISQATGSGEQRNQPEITYKIDPQKPGISGPVAYGFVAVHGDGGQVIAINTNDPEALDMFDQAREREESETEA